MAMTTLPAEGDMSDGAKTAGEMKANLDALLEGTRELPGGQARSEVTIASGQLTIDRAYHSVDTEGEGAADTLTHIDTTGIPEGREVTLRPQDDTREVTVQNGAGGAGQILLADAVDLVMSSTRQHLTLILDGTNWREKHRAP